MMNGKHYLIIALAFIFLLQCSKERYIPSLKNNYGAKWNRAFEVHELKYKQAWVIREIYYYNQTYDTNRKENEVVLIDTKRNGYTAMVKDTLGILKEKRFYKTIFNRDDSVIYFNVNDGVHKKK